MAIPLFIPPCILTPVGRFHPPDPEQPLRIQIEGPLISIERLLPQIEWHLEFGNQPFPQPAGPALARLAYQAVYKTDPIGDLAVRDEYLGWMPEKYPERLIDYYGVTFNHLVPESEPKPEVLQINIIEIEDDNGIYANASLSFPVDPVEFIGKKVLAVPRCCQKRKGTQDRWRVNACVDHRDRGGDVLKSQKEWEEEMKMKGRA